MVYTPYDWNQAVSQRTEYIEERLRDGSPVLALSLPEGPLLLTLHQTQRKLYEIYDRIMFGGIGNQSDLENIRNAAIDFAHREGFQRSPDDVTLQRLVGAALSPAVKRLFSDTFSVPFVARALFIELGESQAEDHFYCLNYDGEYNAAADFAVVAGSAAAENAMTEHLHANLADLTSRDAGLRLGLEAWAIGKAHARRPVTDEEGDEPAPDPPAILKEELAHGTVEAALLERRTHRESKFRLLRPAEFDPILDDYR
jgi:proteasome alpha subunit